MANTQKVVQTEEPKFSFPTEEVTLPSKGLLYDEDSLLKSGKIEMKYMTAREEDILTNQNYIRQGVVIDKLLQSLIKSNINYNDLLIGDKNAIMIAARILAYGSSYEFTYDGVDQDVDLSVIESKPLREDLIVKGKNEFEYTLPHSKNTITFKILTHGDEINMERELKGLKKINKNASNEVTVRLARMITSINGSYESKDIRDFVNNYLLAKDAREFRNYYTQVSPDVDLEVEVEGSEGSQETITIPITVNFFWPDV